MRTTTLTIAGIVILVTLAIVLFGGAALQTKRGLDPGTDESRPSEQRSEGDFDDQRVVLGNRRSATTAAISVFDASSRQAIDAAKVTVLEARGNTYAPVFRGKTDARGLVAAPEIPRARIVVQHDRYVAYSRLHNLHPGKETRIELKRGAGIRLRFESAKGRPLQGIAVALLPPLSRGSWTTVDWRQELPMVLAARLRERESPRPRTVFVHDAYSRRDSPPIRWVRKSDSDGRVQWNGLIPELDYRWACFDAHLPMQTIHPTEAWVADKKMSDFVRPQPDRAASFRVVLHSDTTVKGVIVLPKDAKSAKVRVELEQRVDSGIRGEQRFDLECTQDREFVFRRVIPGTKIIKFSWRISSQGKQDVRFATRRVHVAPDAIANLGRVTPRADTEGARTLVVRLRPPPGTQPKQKAVSCTVVTQAIDRSGQYDFAKNVATVIRIPIDEPFHLRNLPVGKVTITAQFARSGFATDRGWPRSRSWILTLPKAGVVDLHAANSPARVQVTLDREHTKPGTLLILHTRNRDTGDCRMRMIDPSHPRTLSLAMDAGTYDLYVVPARRWVSTWTEERVGKTFEKKGLRLASGQATQLQLGPFRRAHRLRGRVARTGDKYLSFGFADWPSGYVAFRARIKPDGRFRIRNVPPGVVLRETGTGTKIPVEDKDVDGVLIDR